MKINHILFTETKRTPRALALLLGLAMMICTLLLGLQAAKPAQAAGTTFTVNSTGDAADAKPGNGRCETSTAGECTLRAAIQEANAHSGTDTIPFDIPSSDTNCDTNTHVCTIAVDNELPEITQQVTIDGYTQGHATSDTADDATVNTLTEPEKTNASLKIQLFRDGGAEDGLSIRSASNVVIRGLVINQFGQGIRTSGGKGHKIEGNFIGTDPSGTLKKGNFIGVVVGGTNGSTIGGATPDKRNLISGNGNEGVHLSTVPGGASSNTLQGNLIGIDKDGNPLGNGGSGVSVGSGAGNGNRILSNSIYSNGWLGINLDGGDETTIGSGVTANDDKDPDTGPNRLQNYPLITSAQFSNQPSPLADSISIRGTLDSTPSTRHKKRTFIIQFFSSPQADQPSGYGEGRKFLGQTQVKTNRQGDATFDFGTTTTQAEVAQEPYITATATNKATGDTSEFSAAVGVTGIGPVG